jgi:hypothetical protein
MDRSSRIKRHEFVSYRKLLILVSQVVPIAIACYCAFLLRFDFNADRPARRLFWKTVGMVVIAMIYFANCNATCIGSGRTLKMSFREGCT